ncbi:hypothetical protein [Methylorubrum sp. SB2]|uniref:hypothetical protein n=1 Tax=Methylorubrum subtropicum TaxID=3138812 RepID=UPI00313ADD73
MTPHAMTTQAGTGAVRPVRKRWHVVRAKPGQLLARYGRDEPYNNPDVIYSWPDRNGKCDTRVLMRAFEELIVHDGNTLRQELEARGYDITTLRFSIKRLPVTPTPDAPTADHPRGGGLSSNTETAR